MCIYGIFFCISSLFLITVTCRYIPLLNHTVGFTTTLDYLEMVLLT